MSSAKAVRFNMNEIIDLDGGPAASLDSLPTELLVAAFDLANESVSDMARVGSRLMQSTAPLLRNEKQLSKAVLKAENARHKALLSICHATRSAALASLRKTVRIFGENGSAAILGSLLTPNDPLKDDLKTIKISIIGPSKLDRPQPRAQQSAALGAAVAAIHAASAAQNPHFRYGGNEDLPRLYRGLHDRELTETKDALAEARAELAKTKHQAETQTTLRLAMDAGHAVRLATNLRHIEVLTERVPTGRLDHLAMSITQHSKAVKVEWLNSGNRSEVVLRGDVFGAAERVDFSGLDIKLGDGVRFGGKITTLVLQNCEISGQDLKRLIMEGAPRLRRLALLKVRTDLGIATEFVDHVAPTLQHLSLMLVEPFLPGRFFKTLADHGVLRSYWGRHNNAAQVSVVNSIPDSVLALGLSGHIGQAPAAGQGPPQADMASPMFLQQLLDRKPSIISLNVLVRGPANMVNFIAGDLDMLRNKCMARGIEYTQSNSPSGDFWLATD